MTTWKVLIVGAALIVGTGGIALQAKQPAQGTAAKTSSTSTATPAIHHEMGTVNSLTSSALVLTHEYKGKAENTAFTLNSSTKKDGTIDKGERVEVYYQEQNHQRIATEVKPEPKKS